MVGAKPGSRVLVAGATTPRLAAEIALVTGLNGQTIVAAPERERTALERAAADAGSLIEITGGDGDLASLDLTGFDITVVPGHLADVTAEVRVRRFADGLATLRAGGRLVAIDEPRRGAFGFGGTDTADVNVIVAELVKAGALAARHLATAEGMSYYEARRG
jgi:hypothetical protein